jgi:hypothetical protein
LCAAGLRPQLQKLENGCSAILKDYLRAERMVSNLSHWAATVAMPLNERFEPTRITDFIAGLCSLDPNFPLHLWNRLVPQSLITLNLLRGSQINLKLSDGAQINGTFDFN